MNCIILLILFCIIGGFLETILLSDYETYFPIVYAPSVLYENTEMNGFGCWFCFILIRLIIPLNTIFLLLAIILYYPWTFIEWLFTVGRKDDE